MAYNTKPITTDVDGNPVSQYYNKELDQYEPVEGSNGANKVIVYNEDGTENNSLSLISILDKLSQLTGTVIDEETRKSNELQRIALYDQISQMLADGELKGDKGDAGPGLEFDWQGTSLGVRIEGDTDLVYVDLRGPQGEQGPPGAIENLDKTHIEDALGYVPADEDIIGQLASLTTEQKANLVVAINEVKSQSNQMATVELPKKTKRINLKGQLQVSDYRKSVIALCDADNTEITLNSYSIGTLSFKRGNGALGAVSVDISAGKKHNSQGMNFSSLYKGHPFRTFEPCTFTYNGKKYGGIELYIHDASFEHIEFNGATNFDIFGVDYYDNKDKLVINAEIANSIRYDTITLNDALKFNNKDIATTDKIDVLWNGDATGTSVTLANDITKYNILIFGYHKSTQKYTRHTVDFGSSTTSAGNFFNIPVYASDGDIKIAVTSPTVLGLTIPSGYAIYNIVGIKRGGF